MLTEERFLIFFEDCEGNRDNSATRPSEVAKVAPDAANIPVAETATSIRPAALPLWGAKSLITKTLVTLALATGGAALVYSAVNSRDTSSEENTDTPLKERSQDHLNEEKTEGTQKESEQNSGNINHFKPVEEKISDTSKRVRSRKAERSKAVGKEEIESTEKTDSLSLEVALLAQVNEDNLLSPQSTQALLQHKKEYPSGKLSLERNLFFAMRECLLGHKERGLDLLLQYEKSENHPVWKKAKTICEKP